MDVQIVIVYTLGLLWLYIQTCCASSLHTKRLRRFSDNDQRTRNKRNATVTYADSTESDAGGGVQGPAWMKYYGFESYKQRKAYQENPNKKPTLCFNNKTTDGNGQILQHFICPMDDSQSDEMTYCCGENSAQVCCNQTKFNEDRKVKEHNGHGAEMDLVTGISIAAGFIVSTTFCLFLYCCCCQRRHEIHDGVKLMWVRRSFGKELKSRDVNRLEQPAYQDHMTVVNSITGLRETSRQGSRQGSRHGSRQASRQGSIRSNRSRQGSFKGGSRNPSAAPTPSISRRPSNDHHDRTPLKNQKGSGDRNHLGLDVPSKVVITVTTPSDEHGPTAPLLKTAHHENPET